MKSLHKRSRVRVAGAIGLISLSLFSSARADDSEQVFRAKLFYQPVFTLFNLYSTSGSRAEYQTNGTSYAGAGVLYQDFEFELSVPVSIYQNDTASRGKTSQRMIAAGKSWNHHRIEGYYGDYTGFYGLLASGSASETFQRPDIELQETAIKYSYAIWSDNFSYRKFDDFKRGERYFAQAVALVVQYDQMLLSSSYCLMCRDASSAPTPSLTGMRSNRIGFGSAYSMVHAYENSQWYLEGSLAAGPERQEIMRVSGGELHPSITAFLNVKAAYTYSFKIMTLGLSLDYGSTFSRLGGDSLWTHSFLPKLSVQEWF